jgi:HD-GYP domain-containing protein (c-di-GMP phosphodiesterase class II)
MPPTAETTRRLAEYETLLEFGVQLASTLDLGRVLALALQKAEELCHAESSSIWELDDESGELFFRVVRGRAAPGIQSLRVPRGRGIVGDVALTGRAEIVNDVADDTRWSGDSDTSFTTRSILTAPLIARGRVIGVLQLLNRVGGEGFDADDLRRMELFAGPLAAAVANARLYAEQKRQFLEMVTALAEAIERRDPYTGGHVRRVVTYSVLIGQELGLPPERLEELRLAAILHDIGKIAVPDQILRKPARLEPDETSVMARHTIDGAEMVGRIRSLRHLLPGIRSHHERPDGRGYPDGLTEGQLPEVPRIIAVADTFDAMTTDRPYRRALTVEDAAVEIARGAGTQFCPRAAAAFGRLFTRGAFTLEDGERLLASLSAAIPRE